MIAKSSLDDPNYYNFVKNRPTKAHKLHNDNKKNNMDEQSRIEIYD